MHAQRPQRGSLQFLEKRALDHSSALGDSSSNHNGNGYGFRVFGV